MCLWVCVSLRLRFFCSVVQCLKVFCALLLVFLFVVRQYHDTENNYRQKIIRRINFQLQKQIFDVRESISDEITERFCAFRATSWVAHRGLSSRNRHNDGDEIQNRSVQSVHTQHRIGEAVSQCASVQVCVHVRIIQSVDLSWIPKVSNQFVLCASPIGSI